MDNKKLAKEELRLELMRVIDKIKLGNDKFPIEIGLLKVLVDIENEISNDLPNKQEIEKGAFGIFRLMTESYSFEKSSLGEEVGGIYKKIKKFVKN